MDAFAVCREATEVFTIGIEGGIEMMSALAFGWELCGGWEAEPHPDCSAHGVGRNPQLVG